MFEGQSIRVSALTTPGVYELCFDRQGEAINKFDNRTVAELDQATRWLAAQPDLKGVLVSSAKDVYIVGADITEFGQKFNKPAEQIAADVAQSNLTFVAFEDLPVPTVLAINGYALGGGLEMALTASAAPTLKFRSMVLPDTFIDQASPERMYEIAGMDAAQIEAKVLAALGVAVVGKRA